MLAHRRVDVSGVERRPDSDTQRVVLTETLTDGPDGVDDEVIAAARAVTEADATHDAAAAAAVGVDLERIGLGSCASPRWRRPGPGSGYGTGTSRAGLISATSALAWMGLAGTLRRGRTAHSYRCRFGDGHARRRGSAGRSAAGRGGVGGGQRLHDRSRGHRQCRCSPARAAPPRCSRCARTRPRMPGSSAATTSSPTSWLVLTPHPRQRPGRRGYGRGQRWVVVSAVAGAPGVGRPRSRRPLPVRRPRGVGSPAGRSRGSARLRPGPGRGGVARPAVRGPVARPRRPRRAGPARRVRPGHRLPPAARPARPGGPAGAAGVATTSATPTRCGAAAAGDGRAPGADHLPGHPGRTSPDACLLDLHVLRTRGGGRATRRSAPPPPPRRQRGYAGDPAAAARLVELCGGCRWRCRSWPPCSLTNPSRPSPTGRELADEGHRLRGLAYDRRWAVRATSTCPKKPPEVSDGLCKT